MSGWRPNALTDGARFPRGARLTGRNAFAHVFARPVKYSDCYFTVLTRSNNLVRPRLGLAIARKIVKSAAARNRIKRIVRESFRQHQQQLGALDCVVLGRTGIAAQDNAVLFAALEQHWRKVARPCAPS